MANYSFSSQWGFRESFARDAMPLGCLFMPLALPVVHFFSRMFEVDLDKVYNKGWQSFGFSFSALPTGQTLTKSSFKVFYFTGTCPLEGVCFLLKFSAECVCLWKKSHTFKTVTHTHTHTLLHKILGYLPVYTPILFSYLHLCP